MIGQRGVPATFGGVERHVEELGARLAADGHEVVVFCRRGYGESEPERYRWMRLVHQRTVDSKHLESFVASATATAATLGKGYDVVHYHAVGPGLFSPVVRALSGAHIVHGDLSVYNLLWWHDRLVVIDFPQAVDSFNNPFAPDLLYRDLQNVQAWFERQHDGFDIEPVYVELIELLAEAGGRVLEREEVYQRVWGYAMARGDRSVDVFVRKLRQKLEKASPGWRYIHTHFGVGYRFAPEPAVGEGTAPEPVIEGLPVEERSGTSAEAAESALQ